MGPICISLERRKSAVYYFFIVFLLSNIDVQADNGCSFKKKMYNAENLFFYILLSLTILSKALFLLFEVCLGIIHNFWKILYTNLRLLACLPEEHNLPLHCSQSEFGSTCSITRLMDKWIKLSCCWTKYYGDYSLQDSLEGRELTFNQWNPLHLKL